MGMAAPPRVSGADSGLGPGYYSPQDAASRASPRAVRLSGKPLPVPADPTPGPGDYVGPGASGGRATAFGPGFFARPGSGGGKRAPTRRPASARART